MTTFTAQVATTLAGTGTAIPVESGSASLKESPATIEVTVNITDPVADLLVLGSWIRVYDGGDAFAAALIESVQRVEVDEGESRAQVVTASGRTLLAEWDRFRVYPPGGPGKAPWDPTRYVGPMSADFDDSTWDTAIEQWAQGISPAESVADEAPINGDPVGYQDPDGPYCWGLAYEGGWDPDQTPAGRCYFRDTFTVGGSATISARLQAAWDDIGEVWLDEIKLGEGKAFSDAGNYLTPITEGVDLTPGTHTVFGWAENLQRGTFNVAGMLASIYQITPTGYGSLLWRLDDTSLCLQDPADEPGVGWGFAIREEHEAAVLRGMPSWTLHFTDAVDSDGNAWSLGTIPLQVGSTLLSMLNQVSETGIYKVVCGAHTRELWIRSEWAASGATWDTAQSVTSKVRVQAFSPQAAEPT